MNKFQNIIKDLRKDASLTQEDLAKALGISKSTIAMWETGKRLPSPELYDMVADYFNVDIDYLYGKQSIKRKISFYADDICYTLDEKWIIEAYRNSNKDTQNMIKRLCAYSELLKDKGLENNET